MKNQNPTVSEKVEQKSVIGSKLPTEWREYMSGWGAAMFNIFVTFPVNKTVFRQQVYGFSMQDALIQLKAEGAIHLYRGILPPLLQKSASTSIMFGTNSQYIRLITDNCGSKNQVLPSSGVKVVAALLAGCTEATLAPFERVQTLMQDPKYYKLFKNTPTAFRQLYIEHGVREYYRGLSAVLIRNGPSNVIFFFSREHVKNLLPKNWTERSSWTSGLTDFFCGACTGALISTLVYPVNVTKTHMMLVIGGKHLSFLTVFSDLMRKRGLKSMFAGVHVNYTRSFLSWGIINYMYEVIHVRLSRLDFD